MIVERCKDYQHLRLTDKKSLIIIVHNHTIKLKIV
jgi:hypothetical protein